MKGWSDHAGNFDLTNERTMKKSLSTILQSAVSKAFLGYILIQLTSLAGVYGRTRPYIVLNGNDTIKIEKCRTYTDPGYTVHDSSGNVITGAHCYINSSPTFTGSTSGATTIYTFQYNYDYGSDTALPVYRWLIILPDTTPPTLALVGSDTVHKEQCTTWTDPGATASDLCEGNITSHIKVTSTPQLDLYVPGTYNLKYEVQDAGANTSIVHRIVIVTSDTTAPVLTVGGTLHDTVIIGSSYSPPSVTSAIDGCDGDLTSSVAVSNSVNTSTPGNYTVTYSVSDFSSNTATVYRYVTVLDTVFDISGTVVAGSSSGPGRAAKVYLIYYNPADTTLTALDTFTFSVGTGPGFHFNDLPAGSYLVKAALDSTDSLYANYLPTYYDSSTIWSGATHITLSNHNVSGVTIKMVSGTNPGGPGFIGGKVTMGANKKEGDPIEGQVILLTTKLGKPVAYTVSDVNGDYKFTNLAYGDYKIYGEAAGKKSVAGIITLSAVDPGNENVDLIVKSTEIITVIYHVQCSAKYTYTHQGASYTFKGDNTLNSNLRYIWDMGDGYMYKEGYNPTHKYAQSGLYRVCLSVSDTVKNCSDSYCEDIKVDVPILGISGLVTAQGAPNSVVNIWLLQHNQMTDGYDLAAKQQIFLDSSSSAYYLFDKLAEGDYLIKASLSKTAPKYLSMMPTYHPSDLKWKDAQKITLNNLSVDNADIQFIKTAQISGKGTVSGTIRVGPQKKEGDPIEDIAVLLLDENGGPVSFDVTGTDGRYFIGNIPNGKYEVYAEVAGMQTFSTWIEITDQTFEFNNINFSVLSTNIVTGLEEKITGVESIKLFPNPATRVLNVQLGLATSQKLNVTVVDMNGKIMSEKLAAFDAGSHTVQIDLSGFAAGTYAVKIQDSTGKLIQANFIKVQ
jgi:PKD repeat protein